MNFISNIFNNREISIFIWFIVFSIWVLTSKKVSSLVYAVLKTFFQWKILLSVFSLILYVSLMVFVFYKIGLWKKTLLKDTIFWFFGVAFIMLINVNKANKDEHYFKKLILDNVKLVIILEFITNLYVFNFIVELLIIPILFVVVVMNTFAETKEEYNPVKKITDFILTIFGIWFIIHALYNILVDYQEFIKTDNLLSFCLTPILTFAYLPFIYFMALYMI